MTKDPLPTTAGEQDTGTSPLIEPTTATPSSDRSDRSTWTVVRRSAIAISVAAVVAVVSRAVGVVHISLVWLLTLSAVLALIGFFAAQAVTADLGVKTFWWRPSFILALILLSGIVVYHEEFDPATHTAAMYSLTVKGTEVNTVELYGEPDFGSGQLLATGEFGQNGLVGGQTYSFFECSTVGTDRRQWLRYHRYGQVWWTPRASLHTPFGTADPALPRC